MAAEGSDVDGGWDEVDGETLDSFTSALLEIVVLATVDNTCPVTAILGTLVIDVAHNDDEVATVETLTAATEAVAVDTLLIDVENFIESVDTLADVDAVEA